MWESVLLLKGIIFLEGKQCFSRSFLLMSEEPSSVKLINKHTNQQMHVLSSEATTLLLFYFFIYRDREHFLLLLNHKTLYFSCHFVCHMPRRFVNLFALDPSMKCNSAIDASALKHVKLSIIDFSCYITSWVLLQDVLFELIECCVDRFSDLVPIDTCTAILWFNKLIVGT
jgi:hypothetical protein